MIPLPLKFRSLSPEAYLFADDAGGFFVAPPDFLHRYALDELNEADEQFLLANGHAILRPGDRHETAFACRWARRQASPSSLSYVILVPTLRCNLTCSYCQVSRAAESALGYDWSDETLAQTLGFLDELATEDLKVEFQGGEPLLRLDLLVAVRDFCRRRFKVCEFVVCTNLQNLTDKHWEFFQDADTRISTSLDGASSIHTAQRTKSALLTTKFQENLKQALERLGPGKVSALPTIDIAQPPDLRALIDAYESYGFSSIYLRPINYQGFARRAGAAPANAWPSLHEMFIELLIERNYGAAVTMEEYYFSQCLRRVLRAGEDNHVDLRNPNVLGESYIVVDYSGRLFPTDEARMLYRTGHIDLSIGHVSEGIDHQKLATLNASSCNNFEPDCIHCAYQSFCGTDIVDDISRYGRIDVPKHDTWFCTRQTAVFDLVFKLLYRDDEKTRHSLARWARVKNLPPDVTPVHS